MKKEDSRNILDTEPFSYQILKDNRVRIFWNDKEVMILKESEGLQFIRKIELGNEKERQLMMAKMTGNFKRGNERLGKMSRR